MQGRALDATVSLDGSDLRALDISVDEHMAGIGRAGALVELGADSALASNPGDAIGGTAVVRVFDAAGEERVFAGIATAARVHREGGETTRLALTIEPRLANLRLRTDCRIFQNLGVVDVAKKVLEGAGYASSEIEDQVADPPPERTSFVQYRESDWSFVTRILGEAGIFCVVTTKDQVDVVTLTDGDLGALSPAELDAVEGDGLTNDAEAVFRLEKRRRIAPGKVTTLVHDFERPKLDPTKSVETGSDAEKSLEVFAYPVRSVDEAEVQRAARVTAESLAASRPLVSGQTSSLRLVPGFRFTIKGHPYEPINGEVLVVSTSLRWSRKQGSSVHTAFQAYPTSEATPWRPAASESRSPARGLVSAVVTGASGKDVDPDGHGRVTVLPYWDRLGKTDETASPKMRAAQLPLGESMFTPRVGWEVLVGHWDGDADDPLVVGRMIHGAAPATYGLPAGKAKLTIQTPTSPGGGSSNEIRFDDAAGSEEMFFNASKDMSQKVGNNATSKITANETRVVGANRTFSVSSSYEEKVTGSRTIAIGGNQVVGVATYLVDDTASHTHSVGGSRNITIGGDHKVTAVGACSTSVGGTCLDLVAGTVSVETAATFNDHAGAVRVDLSAGNRAIEIAGSYSESIGAAKVILAAGDVVTECASLERKTAGAVLIKTKGDHAETSKGKYTGVAAGAAIIKATNVTIEADDLLTIIMGASTITLTPGSVTIAGTSIKVNATADQSGIVLDN